MPQAGPGSSWRSPTPRRRRARRRVILLPSSRAPTSAWPPARDGRARHRTWPGASGGCRGGGRATALTPAGEFARRPAFSPDGAAHRLPGAARRRLPGRCVTDADGGNARADHQRPCESPVARLVAGRPAFAFCVRPWRAISASGNWSSTRGTLRQLTFEPGQELDPAWDPGGTSLAYISEQAGRSSLVVRAPLQPPRVTGAPAAGRCGPRRGARTAASSPTSASRPAGSAAQHGDPVRSARGQAGRRPAKPPLRRRWPGSTATACSTPPTDISAPADSASSRVPTFPSRQRCR